MAEEDRRESWRRGIGTVLVAVAGVVLGVQLGSRFGPEQAVDGIWSWMQRVLLFPATAAQWLLGAAAVVGSALLLSLGAWLLATMPTPAIVVLLRVGRAVLAGATAGVMAGVAGYAATGSLGGGWAVLIVLGLAAAVRAFNGLLQFAELLPASAAEEGAVGASDRATASRRIANTAILVLGGAVIVGVVGSVGQTATAVRLAGDLATSNELAGQGRFAESADRALSVLLDEPSSLRAAYFFACSGWRVGRFDEAATVVDRYAHAGLTVEVVDGCTSSMPMSGLVTTVADLNGGGSSQFLVVRDQRKDPASPTVVQALGVVDLRAASRDALAQGLLAQAAMICHNRAAGMPRLARDQVEDLAAGVAAMTAASAGEGAAATSPPPGVDEVLSRLPKEWGCGSSDSFDID